MLRKILAHPLLAVVIGGLAFATSATRAQCPVTQGSGSPALGQFWFGSDGLSVLMPNNGVWQGMGSAHGFRNKLFWRSSEFRLGNELELRVSGRRLDGDSGPARVSRPTSAFLEDDGGWSMLVLVEFPTPGCWELHGEFRGRVLRVVTQVAEPAVVPGAT
jgi:hypothetical protein